MIESCCIGSKSSKCYYLHGLFRSRTADFFHKSPDRERQVTVWRRVLKKARKLRVKGRWYHRLTKKSVYHDSCRQAYAKELPRRAPITFFPQLLLRAPLLAHSKKRPKSSGLRTPNLLWTSCIRQLCHRMFCIRPGSKKRLGGCGPNHPFIRPKALAGPGEGDLVSRRWAARSRN
jgi:hypothetical protein